MSQTSFVSKGRAKWGIQRLGGRVTGGQAADSSCIGGPAPGVPQKLEETNPEEMWEAMAVLRKKQVELGDEHGDLRQNLNGKLNGLRASARWVKVHNARIVRKPTLSRPATLRSITRNLMKGDTGPNRGEMTVLTPYTL